jgi:hypothetical protein
MEQARANKLQAESRVHEKSVSLYERDLISDLEYRQSLNKYEAEKANFKACRIPD